MDKKRVMPILAGALMAVSLSACQGMMGGDRASSQTSSTQQTPATAAGQQAVSSDLVRDVQRGLASRGYDVGPQDGIYGDTTEQALRRFQRDQRMNATGQIDGQTLAALGVIGGSPMAAAPTRRGAGEYVPTSRRPGAKAPTAGASRGSLNHDQVRNVQQNLVDRGYDPGHIDGIWGTRTQQALRSFQRDQNMRADGRPNDQTLAALGVGGSAPATQTGRVPENDPGSVDLEQRDVREPEQQQGLLPPTGSQAPGAARETERSTLNPGGAPDTRPQGNQ